MNHEFLRVDHVVLGFPTKPARRAWTRDPRPEPIRVHLWARVLLVAAWFPLVAARLCTAGTDLVVPFVPAYDHGESCQTVIWVHNPGASHARVQMGLLMPGKPTATPVLHRDTLAPGETRHYDEELLTRLWDDPIGAVRVSSDSPLVVNSRSATRHGDQVAFAVSSTAVPVSFAIETGQRVDFLGFRPNTGAAEEALRLRLGVIEVVGSSLTLGVTAASTAGDVLARWTWVVGPWSVSERQLPDDVNRWASVPIRLTVEALSGDGRTIVYGLVPSGDSGGEAVFEVPFPARMPTESESDLEAGSPVGAGKGLTASHKNGKVTLNVGAGQGMAVDPNKVSIAPGGVGADEIADGQVVRSLNGLRDAVALAAGSNVTISQDPALGTLTISAAGGNGGGGGDITAVTAGAGLTGGGAIGDVALSVGTGAITSGMIGDGEVSAADAGFNYAGSASAAGPATDLDCVECAGSADLADGAVGTAKIDSTGAISGQAVMYDGANVLWQTPGDITSVSAGTGLSGGGATGDVVVGLAVPMGLIASTPAMTAVIGGSNTGAGAGVIGQGDSGPGVVGATATGVGVLGVDPGGVAGRFNGSVVVTENLTVSGTKSFKIDHPLNPASQYLIHYCVESSEVIDVYSGNTILDAGGNAWVDLPPWLEPLNRDFRYQLTPVGTFAPVYVDQKISGNRFRIAGGAPGMEVSWQVTGLRADPYVRVHGAPIEESKPQTEQGFYLHPELFGQPAERAIDAATYPVLMKKAADQ